MVRQISASACLTFHRLLSAAGEYNSQGLTWVNTVLLATLVHVWQPVCRHGPAFGTNASQDEDGSDPLCEVLAVNGRRCSLIDRNDVLCRHVTGAVPPAAKSMRVVASSASAHKLECLPQCTLGLALTRIQR